MLKSKAGAAAKAVLDLKGQALRKPMRFIGDIDVGARFVTVDEYADEAVIFMARAGWRKQGQRRSVTDCWAFAWKVGDAPAYSGKVPYIEADGCGELGSLYFDAGLPCYTFEAEEQALVFAAAVSEDDSLESTRELWEEALRKIYDETTTY